MFSECEFSGCKNLKYLGLYCADHKVTKKFVCIIQHGDMVVERQGPKEYKKKALEVIRQVRDNDQAILTAEVTLTRGILRANLY